MSISQHFEDSLMSTTSKTYLQPQLENVSFYLNFYYIISEKD